MKVTEILTESLQKKDTYKILLDFIRFAAEDLGLKSLPKFDFVFDNSNFLLTLDLCPFSLFNDFSLEFKGVLLSEWLDLPMSLAFLAELIWFECFLDLAVVDMVPLK